MSMLDGPIYSKVLNREAHFRVLLPHDVRSRSRSAEKKDAPDKKPRALILLHGYSGSYSTWSDYTSIARYASAHDLAVVMPDGAKSFYSDMVHGENYFRFISEELPELCSKMFHISTEPENLMIAGNSMGGYGALRCAMTYPERYAVCGTFSPPADFARLLRKDTMEQLGMETKKCFQAVLGEQLSASENMLPFSFADRIGDRCAHLRIFHGCGKQDYLYAENLKIRGILERQNFKDFYYFEADGGHDWTFWDKAIERFVDYCDDLTG